MPGPTTHPPSASNPLSNEIDDFTSTYPTFVLFESTLASVQFFDIDILPPHYYSNTHSPPNTAHPVTPIGTEVAQLFGVPPSCSIRMFSTFRSGWTRFLQAPVPTDLTG
jgi:hypothetical protein